MTDVPERVLVTMEEAFVVPQIREEDLKRMEAAFVRAAIDSFREMLWRERAALLLRQLERNHPELARRAMYRAIGLYTGKSEHTIRQLCCARSPGKGADLVNVEDGE